MAKTGDQRIDDTVDYLRTKLTPGRMSEVDRKLAMVANKAALGNTLAIGHSGSGATARHAKRALMLLATLFITDPGKRATAVNHAKTLPEGAEAPLLQEIDSWFIAPGVDVATVAREAVANIARMPSWFNGDYDAALAVRGVYNPGQPFNCYNAIIFWAFQAGAISKRFLWNKLYGNSGNVFFPTYSRVGWTTLYDHENNIDTIGAGPVNIPVGRTVYFETPAKVFGHVAMSLGNGMCISQNSVMDFDPAAMNGATGAEWTKMANARPHILPIREMLTWKFKPDHGYPRLKQSNGAFWEPFPIDER
jgi:hypothetical protein